MELYPEFQTDFPKVILYQIKIYEILLQNRNSIKLEQLKEILTQIQNDQEFVSFISTQSIQLKNQTPKNPSQKLLENILNL